MSNLLVEVASDGSKLGARNGILYIGSEADAGSTTGAAAAADDSGASGVIGVIGAAGTTGAGSTAAGAGIAVSAGA